LSPLLALPICLPSTLFLPRQPPLLPVSCHTLPTQTNTQALRADLAQYLADGHIDPLKAPPTVTVRPTTKQIVIKGRAVEEVKAWLEMRGF